MHKVSKGGTAARKHSATKVITSKVLPRDATKTIREVIT